MAWHDRPKARDHPAVQAYIDDLDAPQRAIVEAVRQQVRRDPDVVEAIAWGVPFWFRRGPICYASAAKRHVTLGMARGIEIQDASSRLVGTGRSPIRKCVLRLDEGLPASFSDWLAQAFALDEAGE